MTQKPPVLKIDDLRTYFRTAGGIARAVDGVSFSIGEKETYALVGESGCGKSVTALSVMDLVPPPAGRIESGTITLSNRTISGLPPVEMRKIRGNRVSMIFQEPMTALNPVFTIGNQISEAVLLHRNAALKEARAIAVDMLERVGIPDAASRYYDYPHQMSGGMRQRVMIAIALVCQPEVLIADEPTTALDVTIQSQILELIRNLKDEFSTAVLLITHDMGVVKENADRVGVMYAGRIVEEASRDQLFASPRHPYTQLLLRSMPARAERNKPLAAIKGMVPKATDFPPGCRFHNRCPYAFDRCRREAPRRLDANTGHYAECFLLDAPRSQHSALRQEPAAAAPTPGRGQRETRLEIRGLKMHFPIRKGLLKRTVATVKAVDGVTMRVGAGETVALVGESGCGKTTAGKCLIRLLDPTAGAILLENTDIAAIPKRRVKDYRRRIQMIFQDPFSSLNPRMMIRNIITEGMTAHRIGSSFAGRTEKAGDLMERVGLDKTALDRYPHEFSGGQRQRIGLARALALNPDLIVCDEATSSLDVSIQAQILNLLKRLQSEFNVSYLFITHDLSVVKYLADRVYVMYLGRIVEEGTNDEIFSDPQHPYTRALLSAVPHVDEATGRRRIVLGGDVPSPVSPPAGCHFHPRCPEADAPCRENYPQPARLASTHLCRCLHRVGIAAARSLY
ncbi:MAG: ABC transporter ATP-binding protein [Kiritimatiellia bacterium]